MKKLLFLSAIIAGSLSFQTAKAQIGIHLNLNLGTRPDYAPLPPPPPPVQDYYYLPDAEAYYSVPEQVYYYQSNGRWVSGACMPGRFHDYDYSHMRHYVVNEPRPYLRNDYYRDHFRNPQFARNDNRDFRNPGFNDGPRGRNDGHRSDRDFDRRDQGPRGRDDYRDGRDGRY